MMTADYRDQQQHTAAFRLAVKERSDNLMNYFLPCFFLMGLAVAGIYGTWLIALGVGSLCLIAYYSVKTALPDSDLYQYVLSVILGIFMAQYIYQMHGLFEMHFFAFIGSAILITYQNWKLQIPMLVVVLLHHAILGYLQDIGFDKVYFTQLNTFELQTFAIHILLSAVIFFTCGLWGYQLKKYSEIQIGQVVEMGRLQQEAVFAADARDRELEQRSAAMEKAVAQGKFEMASDVLHDIGNAVVGFGSYLTRVQRMQEEDRPENLEKLADFFETQRNPISIAIGEVKAEAVVKMLNGLSKTQKNNQEQMNRSIAEQLHIVNHIQEILHIQRQYISGKETQERKPVNIRNIINDCLSMLHSPIEKKAVAVPIAIPEGLPLIKGDRTKLMQLILTLLKNSLEAIDDQAAEKTISIQACSQDRQLILMIRDNGCGFDKEVDRHLFERGFSTKSSGSGMGLYNCRTIVESHEGSMSIKSEGRGKGALATIHFKI